MTKYLVAFDSNNDSPLFKEEGFGSCITSSLTELYGDWFYDPVGILACGLTGPLCFIGGALACGIKSIF